MGVSGKSQDVDAAERIVAPFEKSNLGQGQAAVSNEDMDRDPQAFAWERRKKKIDTHAHTSTITSSRNELNGVLGCVRRKKKKKKRQGS